MRPERSERGAALLTVLLLVAVVAVMAGTALEKLRVATRLTGNTVATGQARAFANAAETMAMARVTSLLAFDRDKVTLLGGWSDRPFGLPLPGGGSATARVTDGGNCFNVNGLVQQTGPGVYVDYAPARLEFVRLMQLVGVPGNAANQIAAGTQDWIDSDQDVQPGGAEDPTYLAQATPYRTAGTLMADTSELRAVAGVTPDIYRAISPWVCALPLARPVAINIDTLAPERAPLLAMLAPDTLPIGAAQQALSRRPPTGFSDTGAFWQQPSLASIGNLGAAQGRTAVTTTWFALRIDVAQASTTLTEHATVDANRLPVRLVSRQWGEDP
ncbi:type II secretion system minor pseudopilin GspK [uncultured Sphingomonas sp.]|uniref:type II secretion system minor pseudopilin GspK n=1 Tax=uncultured Sphingomonas sp. TaxID=158754 RepID=UPI0035C9C449